MKGSIRQRSKGSWQIILDTGTGPNGERRRVYETVRSSRKSDAQRRLNELLVSLEKACMPRARVPYPGGAPSQLA